MRRKCIVYHQGITPYLKAWKLQKSLVEARKLDPKLPDILIVLQHPPVYTLGTAANPDFIKFNPLEKKLDVFRIERGGEVTYHCPGQIVVYPIMNLKYYQQDLHWYLRQLEEVIIQVLAIYKLKGYRIPGLTGVWVEGCKVAAIGIKVSRWITMHGFALNVSPDLSGFQEIIPCGIRDKPVGSLVQFIPDITLEKVRQDIIRVFAEIFEMELVDNQEIEGIY